MTTISIFSQAQALRTQADANYTKYVVQGRIALTQLMGELYKIYHATQQLNDVAKNAAVNEMRAALPEGQVRSNTKHAAIFIRYVFAQMNDKQVHTYSTALQHAYSKQVPATGFVAYVDSVAQGFEGIRKLALEAATGTQGKSPIEVALPRLQAQDGTVVDDVAESWGTTETIRVYIATKDGTSVVLRDSNIRDQAKLQSVLSIYNSNYAELNKKVLSDDDIATRNDFNESITQANITLEQTRHAISSAVDAAAKRKAEFNFVKVQAEIAGYEKAIKQLGKVSA